MVKSCPSRSYQGLKILHSSYISNCISYNAEFDIQQGQNSKVSLVLWYEALTMASGRVNFSSPVLLPVCGSVIYEEISIYRCKLLHAY